MLRITIDNGNGPVNYTTRIVPGTLSIEDNVNQPVSFNFDVVNIGTDFVVPRRGAYVKVESLKYHNVLATGFVTNEPEKEFIGSSGQRTLSSSTIAGAYLQHTVKCVSDDWLLNVHMVPFVPALVNQTMGQILRLLAETLVPNFYTFDVDDGDIIPIFKYDPKKKWSEIAKEFADAIRYHFWVKDKVIYFKPYGDKVLGVSYDDALPLQGKVFDPKTLNTTPLDTPIVNDVIMIGDVEPHRIREDHFIGTGVEGDFVLRHKVFGGASELLLEEKWDGSDFRNELWEVVDPDTRFSLAGALNVGPGSGPLSLGSAYIKGKNGLELGGKLDIDNGEFEFLSSSTGLIGGIYDSATLSQASCNAGFMVSGYSVSGGIVAIHPVIDGVMQPAIAAGKSNKHYRLQMLISTGTWTRYEKTFRTLSGVSFGGTELASESDVTFIVEEISLDATPPAPLVRSTFRMTLPAFGLYAIVNSVDLDAVITFTQLAKPIQAALYARSLYGPYGNELPILNLADEEHHQLGFGLQNQTATISDVREYQMLRFYGDTIPAVGSRLRLRSWESGRSLARVRDDVSIANEAVVSGDDGVRSAIVTDLNPTPRTSEDCELAAEAFIQDRKQTQYNGSYQFMDDFWQGFSRSLASPPVTGDIDYPRTGRYLSVNSPMRGVSGMFVVRRVQATVAELQQEKIQWNVEFGPDLYVPKLLPRFFKPREEILLPRDVAEEPVIQSLTDIGITFLPDLDEIRLTSVVTGTQVTVTSNATVSGNQVVEVRRVDSGWGTTDQNLILQTTLSEFTLDRMAIEQTWYFRIVDTVSGKTSRRTSVIRVVYPLVPDSPAGVLDTRDFLKPEVQLQIPGDVRNVWGIEIRSCMEVGPTTFDLPVVSSPGLSLGVTLEMVERPKQSVNTEARSFTSCSLYLDPADYDFASYYFEVVAQNVNVSDAYNITLEKTDGTVISQVSVPANTTSRALIRSATSFTPDTGKTAYRIKLDQTASNNDLQCYAARIFIRQVGASKTRIQCTMIHTGAITSLDDFGFGDNRFNVTTYTAESQSYYFFKQELLLADIVDWSLETVARSTGSTMSVGLAQKGTIAPVVAETTHDTTLSLADVTFPNSASGFTDGDEFELITKVNGTPANTSLNAARVYCRLENISRVLIFRRVAGNGQAVTTSDKRQLFDASEYESDLGDGGTFDFEFESTGAETAGGDRRRILSYADDDTLSPLSDVSTSDLAFPDATKRRLRACILPMPVGEKRFIGDLQGTTGTVTNTMDNLIVKYPTLVQLFEDDFSGYSDGATPGLPEWTTSVTAGSPAPTLTKETYNGSPILQARLQISGSASQRIRQLLFAGYSSIYPEFPATPYGVWVSCIWLGHETLSGNAHLTQEGICIGLNSAISDFLVWNFRGGRLVLDDGAGSVINLVTGMAVPDIGDTCRLQLVGNSTTSRLEAYINDVLVGSTTNSVIILGHANPKKTGFAAKATGSFDAGVDVSRFSDFKSGVI